MALFFSIFSWCAKGTVIASSVIGVGINLRGASGAPLKASFYGNHHLCESMSAALLHHKT